MTIKQVVEAVGPLTDTLEPTPTNSQPRYYILASRLYRPESRLYVADIPRKGTNGRYCDWEYCTNRDKAQLLDWHWAQRFVRDCLEVGAAVALEPMDVPEEQQS